MPLASESQPRAHMTLASESPHGAHMPLASESPPGAHMLLVYVRNPTGFESICSKKVVSK